MHAPRFVILTVLLQSLTIAEKDKSKDKPLLMLIVYDGLRWNYIDNLRSRRPNNSTPNFDFLSKTGVTARHVSNVFPSLTLPSHLTLLTGLYPESHGIVGNQFYDPQLMRYYQYNSSDNFVRKFFDCGSEPIWVTNDDDEKERYSGAILFPGTLTEMKGKNVTYRSHSPLFNTNITYKERVDQMIDWFTLPNKSINLGLFYYDEPDLKSHDNGPESSDVYNMIGYLDEMTGYLLDRLRANGLYDRMNLIFTADHGGTYLSQHRIVDIGHYVDDNMYTFSSLGELGMIYPRDGKEKEVYRKLKIMQDENAQVKVFWKNDSSPEVLELHFANNDRISPIVIVPDLGWLVTGRNYTNSWVGTHGYNTSSSDMWPFFIARGPAFQEGLKTEVIHQIDIYELMCHILNIDPAPNNGSLRRISVILKQDSIFTSLVTCVVMVASSSVISLVFSVFVVKTTHRSKS